MALQFSVTPTNTQPITPVASATPAYTGPTAGAPLTTPFGTTPNMSGVTNTSTYAFAGPGQTNTSNVTVGGVQVPGTVSTTTGTQYSNNPSVLSATPNGNILNPVQTPANTSGSTNGSTTATPGSTTTSSPSDVQSQIDNLKNTTASDTGTTYNNSNGFTDTPYTIGTDNFDSNGLAGNTSYSDVLNQRQQLENQYAQIYNNYVQSQVGLNTAKLQDQGLVNNALYSGDTTSYGQGAAGVAQNAANIREAMLQTQAQTPLLQLQGISNMLGFQNQDIQNQLATVPNLQNVTQAADGSIVGFIRDPLTGQVTTQNFGNPLTGTFSSDGQTGASIGGGSSTQNQNGAGSISLPSNGDGTYQTANGGSVNATYAEKISQLSPQYQSYALSGPQGVAYIDSTRLSALPQGVQYQIQQQAAAAGIPWLDQSQASGMQQVQDLYTTLDATQQLVNTALKSGPAGAITDYARTQLNNIFQTEPLLQGFNSLRTQAGAADTSLMGGIGSGFRQNTANLELSIQNFPTSSDSVETANAKIANIKYLLDTSLQKTFPGLQTGSSLVNNGQQSGYTGSFINTSVGPIPNSY